MFKPHLLARRLSGGTHPRAVSLAVFLGLLAGFVQGWNLSLAALLVLIVLFDVRSRVALVCWGIGVGLSWALTPATFLLGRVVLDLTPLGTFLGDFEGVAALFGWDRYTMVGGLLVGLALAWPASTLLTRGVRRTRQLLQQARELRSKLTADAVPDVIAFPRARISWKARLLDWLRGARRADSAGTGREPLFRPGGIPAAAALVLVASGTVFWHLPRMMSGELYLAMQAANQARLEAAEFRLALWDGLLDIRDLRLADPNCLTHDRVRVEQLRAVLDPEALLRGRLALMRLDVSGVRTHVERATPAEPTCDAADSSLPATVSKPLQQPAVVQEDSARPEAYLSNWPAIEQAIVRLGELLEPLQTLNRFEVSRGAPLSLASIAETDLATLRRIRSPLGRREPRISVATLRADAFDSAWRLGPRATFHAARLSSRPALGRESPRFEIVMPDRNARVSGEYASHQGRSRWRVALEARKIPAAELLASPSADQPLRIVRGQISLDGTGWADVSGFEMPLIIEAHALACQATNHAKLADIDAEHWAAGLERLNRFAFEANCQGAWRKPRLRLDGQQIARRFREDLANAAQHDLLAAMGVRPEPATGSPKEMDAQSPPRPSQPITTPVLANQEPGTDSQPAGPPTTSIANGTSSQMPPSVAGDPLPEDSAGNTTSPATLPRIESLAPAQRAQPASTQVATVQRKTVYPIRAAELADRAAQASTSSAPAADPSPVSAATNEDPSATAVAQPALVSASPATESPDGTATDLHRAEPLAGPLEGPGPLDLTLGHDMNANLWQPSREPRHSAVAQTAATSRVGRDLDLDREAPLPSEAGIDEWVEQQEAIEARRQHELASEGSHAHPERRPAAMGGPADEATPDDSRRPDVLGWFRSLWPFGSRGDNASHAEGFSPAESGDKAARTARGEYPATSAGSSTLR